METLFHVMLWNGRPIYIPTSVPIELRRFVDPNRFIHIDNNKKDEKENNESF